MDERASERWENSREGREGRKGKGLTWAEEEAKSLSRKEKGEIRRREESNVIISGLS